MAIKNVFLNSYANRGMNLEKDINDTNKYYLEKNIAIIHKKPTPIRVNKVIYNNYKTLITEAFYESASTTDYNGLYKGKYIDFDAKETKTKSFPLENIHVHQLEHLKKIYEHGGISFLIVRFNIVSTSYLIETRTLVDFINNFKRKSIPIEYFEENAYKIKESYIPRIDYLKIIDKLYF